MRKGFGPASFCIAQRMGEFCIDGPVRTHAYVEPLIITTMELLADGHQVGQHFPDVLDQFIIFEFDARNRRLAAPRRLA
jgi:hypothetical protein